MIRNIVLDMGNVLLDFNPEVSLDRYCSSEEEKDIIRNELFRGPEWIMGDKGEIKDRDRFELVKGRVPEEYHEALRNCVDHWDICMTPLDGALTFVQTLKNSGYRVYVLSNASDKFYSYFPKAIPTDLFDGLFVSADYLMLKPDVAIYRKFLEVFGLKADECFFIDDMPQNAEGARQAGMYALQFKGDYSEAISAIPKS